MDLAFGRTARLSGRVRAPGSKSYTHRMLAAASLAGETLVENPSRSEANMAMAEGCRRLGARVEGAGGLRVSGTRGRPRLRAPVIDVGNSGTALRILVGLASLADGRVAVTGDASLRARPTGPLIGALNALGADVRGAGAGGCAPVEVNARGLRGGSVEIDASASSQFVSSLLLAAPLAREGVEVRLRGEPVSAPYIGMTADVLGRFGVRVAAGAGGRSYSVAPGQELSSGGSCRVPGDYSQAAFPLAAGCLVDSDVEVHGLEADGQGDSRIVGILRGMGADVRLAGGAASVRGPARLQGGEWDLRDTPDLFPVLAVLGMYAEGSTRLHNMPNIRAKETDRIAVMGRELRRCGARVEEGPDEMTVHGLDVPPGPRELDASGAHGVADHRAAMALSLVGLRSGPAVVRGAGRIAVSYPGYADDMRSLGARVADAPAAGQAAGPRRRGRPAGRA